MLRHAFCFYAYQNKCMKTLLSSFLVLIGFSTMAQNSADHNIKYNALRLEYVNYFSLYQNDDGGAPQFDAPGITMGASTQIGVHWLGSADLSILSKKIERSGGYNRININGLRTGIDLFFNKAYQGFYIGGGMGYNWMSQSQYEGATAITNLPKSHALFFFDLGFMMKLHDRWIGNFKWTFAGKPSSGTAPTKSHEFRLGIGYRF